ncbi:MAG: segregation/condensation protein A [candidate division Zixibacteria bacterium]|nr:segregation/condensation protein A [candidate division Zixibacteria bacterium]
MTGNMITISEDLLGYGVQPFEGPLDLLLYLIKQDEVDIYDIPIAKITSQYLAYLEAMKELDLEIAGEFILMASMLIRIKSQMLMPKPEDEELDIDDPRSELVAALLEYKKFKQAAEDLGQRSNDWSIRSGRGDFPEIAEPEVSYVLGKIDIANLMIAFGEVLERAKRENVHNVRTEEIHIEDRIKRIAKVMSDNSEGCEFYQLFEDDPRRPVLIVTFIAILELSRLGHINIKQSTNFSKIWVYPTELKIEDAIELYAETI